MPERPSQLWKALPAEKRVLVAEAFWRDETSPEIEVQHLEAALLLAKRLNFRPKSVIGLSVDRRARHLAQVADVSDAVATRGLIAYHFALMRPLMAAFLDALGISHDNGLITDEDLAPPDRERLAQALASVRGAFETHDVDLYVKTLAALDSETWQNLDGLTAPTSPRGT